MRTLARVARGWFVSALALGGVACLPDYVLIETGASGTTTTGGASVTSGTGGSAATTTTGTGAGGQGGSAPVVTGLALGYAHSCALRDDGSVWCWGDNARLQVGSDGLLQPKPVRVQGLGAASAIVAGSGYTCAILLSGAVACWGENVHGELGIAPSSPHATPVTVALPGKAIAIAASLANSAYTCAILEGGAVSCWGNADAVQRCGGPSTTLPATNPALAGATQLILGHHDTCAIVGGGHLVCCGENNQGQLGNGTSGTTTSTLGPTVPALAQVTHAAMGEYQICAVDHGTALCWGDNVQGQLCLDPQASGSVKSPTPIPGLSGATAFAEGWRHSCALIDGRVWCCGGGGDGQLGNGSTSGSSVPVTSGLTGVTAIATGWTHTCALLGDGSVRCWGKDDLGELGDGKSGMGLKSASPVEVAW